LNIAITVGGATDLKSRNLVQPFWHRIPEQFPKTLKNCALKLHTAHKKSPYENRKGLIINVVPTGIEPVTQGFSVPRQALISQ
jgi:hypothetical protein